MFPSGDFCFIVLKRSVHTAFPRKIWEAIGGCNEIYDGWWGYDDVEFGYCVMVDGGFLLL